LEEEEEEGVTVTLKAEEEEEEEVLRIFWIWEVCGSYYVSSYS
jgi:hypothetical protein